MPPNAPLVAVLNGPNLNLLGERPPEVYGTHTSVAIRHAIAVLDAPVIEVHITNVHRREAFRGHSYLSDVVDGVIAGCGTQGYALAISRIAHLDARTTEVLGH
jgi:3-dehydroquinate dehydratase